MNKMLKQYLDAWYQTDAGQHFSVEIKTALTPMLRELFGYTAIQLGHYPPDTNLLAESRVNTNWLAGEKGDDVDCRPEQTPFASDAIDLLIMPHTLELSRDPHAVLREVDRMLVPEGHVIIVGLNPWTAWGIWQRLRYRRAYPFYTLGRIRDWLGLLGFECLGEQSCHISMLEIPLPARLENSQLIKKLSRKTAKIIAGGYVVLAKKKVTTMMPIKPRWPFKPRLVSTGLTEPTTRQVNRQWRK